MENQKEPRLGDMLEYIEARNKVLDEEGTDASPEPDGAVAAQQFMSLIKFNGVPILPPVLTQNQREEMHTYKNNALRLESKKRARRREELHARVQSIVAGVEEEDIVEEERRAAKAAARLATPSADPTSQSPGKPMKQPVQETLTTLVTGSSTVHPTEGGKVPIEITISVPDNAITKQVSAENENSKTVAAAKSPVHDTSAKIVSKSKSVSTASPKSNLSYLKNMGKLSKQKSFSSQHLDRSPSSLGKTDSEGSSSSPGKKELSPKSRALLPHPPEGRPGRKGSSVRQSMSTPDLRTIDFRVEADELRKPIHYRSRSPKGGRPQSADPNACENEKKEMKTEKGVREKRASERSEQVKTSKSVKDTSRREIDKSKDMRKLGKNESLKKKNAKSDSVLQNPLEKLEQELTLQEQRERNALAKQKQESEYMQNKINELAKEEQKERAFLEKQRQAEMAREQVRPEVDPIEIAAAELQALNITEEQALATLDSLQSDFASLEQMDSLPQDYNGIPLTNRKQQQIIHMLTKLSTALNIEDTLTSTTNSNASGEPQSVIAEQTKGDITGRKGNNVYTEGSGCVQNGANQRNNSQVLAGELERNVDDSSLSITSDSNVTGPSQQGSILSSSSNQSRTRMSPSGSSSILSSASSVSASRLRMSPKSLKNTVHFSSFITEISTSASQSMEDKISVRKLDITPASSTNFDNPDAANSSSENVPKNSKSSGSRSGPSVSQQPESLLSKVALSPSVDGSPSEIYGNLDSSHDGELNTSDKENEFIPQDESSDENFDSENRPNNRHVLNVYTANIPQGPIGSQHPAVVKSSVKSDASDSTLKGSQDKLSSQENLPMFTLGMDTQYNYGSNITSLGKSVGKTAMDSSISSFQEEITRSYMLSQQQINKTGQVVQKNKKEELKRASLKGIQQWPDSPIILKPVIYNHSPKQDTENTNTEQQTYSSKQLDKVELENIDVNSVSSEEETDYSEHNNKEIKNVDVPNNLNVEVDNSEKQVFVEPLQPEYVHEPIKSSEVYVHEPIRSSEVEEEEGKAEHIQKYLTHVHEQSLQNEEEFDSVNNNEIPVHGDVNVLDNISSSIQTFMSSIQGMNHLSHEELFNLQAQQFELLQEQLIEQQRSQLEELFVQQRREQMNLQQEIEQYQHQIQGQDEIETINLGESLIKPKLSASQPQVSTVPAWQYQAPIQSSQEPAVAQMNINPDISRISHNTTLSTIPYQDPVAQPNGFQQQEQQPDRRINSGQNRFAYIPSPSLCRNPKDFDNGSDVSSILMKGSPKQLLFSNQSTPIRKEPKVYKPVLRSPMKQPSYQKPTGRVTIPQEVFDPAMQKNFSRVSAAVKGYLTRRLLKTQKVQEILKTINDTRNFAFSFQAESPMKKGTLSREDRILLERIVAQLQAALLDIHEIFFIIPVDERMALIAHSRQLEQDRKLRESQRSSMESVSKSQRLSTATLKAMERKKKAQLAEEAVFGSCEFRPKSAPPATSSPATDISGPIRRHFQSLFNRALKPLQGHISPIRPDSQISVRALKPLQGHISPIRPDSQISVREMKERPKSAPNKNKKESSGNKNRKTASNQSSNKNKSSSTAVPKTKPSFKTKEKKPEKAWR